MEGFLRYFKVAIPMGKVASTFAIAYLLRKLFLPLQACSCDNHSCSCAGALATCQRNHEDAYQSHYSILLTTDHVIITNHSQLFYKTREQRR